MVQPRMVQHFHDRVNRARLGVVRTIYQAAHASVHQRARAHGARLNCNKQFAVAQTVVTNGLTRLAQGNNFRVSSGIVIGQIAVPSAADNRTIADDDRAYWHFVRLQRALSAAQGLFHPEFVSEYQWSVASG